MVTFEYTVQGRNVEDLEAQAAEVLATLVPEPRQNGYDMAVEPMTPAFAAPDAVPVLWLGRVTGWVKDRDG